MTDLTLVDALHLLYEPASSRHWTGVHSIKFDVEHLMWLHREGSYVTDEAVRNALPPAGFPSRMSTPPKGWLPVPEFCVKPRFPMTWVWNDVQERPQRAKKAHWEAYQRARTPRVSPTEPTASGSQ